MNYNYWELVPTMQNLVDWKMQFTLNQYMQIIYGLHDDLDISWYANPEYTPRQMTQIRWGLETDVDVSKYADPSIPWDRMFEIRISLTN